MKPHNPPNRCPDCGGWKIRQLDQIGIKKCECKVNHSKKGKMKRSILFHGFRTDGKGWVEGDLYHGLNDLVYVNHVIDIDAKSQKNELSIVDPDSVGQYSGKDTCKGNKIFDGSIVFNEYETDEGDQRTYMICKWIEEWSMFAFLTYGEFIKYQDLGAESLDEDLFWTYTLENSNKYHYAGEYFDRPELLK